MDDGFYFIAGAILGLILGLMISLYSCSITNHGSEWERCYPNDTCDENLTCFIEENKCVPVKDGGL